MSSVCFSIATLVLLLEVCFNIINIVSLEVLENKHVGTLLPMLMLLSETHVPEIVKHAIAALLPTAPNGLFPVKYKVKQPSMIYRPKFGVDHGPPSSYSISTTVHIFSLILGE